MRKSWFDHGKIMILSWWKHGLIMLKSWLSNGAARFRHRVIFSFSGYSIWLQKGGRQKLEPNGSKWIRMVQNGSEWFRMAPNGSEWYQMHPNSSEWFRNGSEWFRMAPNAFKWLQMDPNGSSEWISIVQNCAELFRILTFHIQHLITSSGSRQEYLSTRVIIIRQPLLWRQQLVSFWDYCAFTCFWNTKALLVGMPAISVPATWVIHRFSARQDQAPHQRPGTKYADRVWIQNTSMRDRLGPAAVVIASTKRNT